MAPLWFYSEGVDKPPHPCPQGPEPPVLGHLAGGVCPVPPSERGARQEQKLAAEAEQGETKHLPNRVGRKPNIQKGARPPALPAQGLCSRRGFRDQRGSRPVPKPAAAGGEQMTHSRGFSEGDRGPPQCWNPPTAPTPPYSRASARAPHHAKSLAFGHSLTPNFSERTGRGLQARRKMKASRLCRSRC